MNKLIILILLLSCNVASANFYTKKKDTDTTVSEAEVQEALKETLKQGVNTSSKELSTEKIKVTNSLFGLDLPSELKKIGDVLTQAGESQDLKDFEEALNESVKAIMTGAKGVFDDAIDNLTIYDAYAVLNKGNSAATDYLKKQSEDKIKDALGPIVQKALTSSGALDKWSQILSQYNKLTGQDVNFNIVDFISGEAVDDMFDKLAKEEAKIRVNSYLWGSFIMKEVFHRQIR